MNYLSLIGRRSALFGSDLKRYGKLISELVENSRFLVIGGAGSIGQAVTKEIFRRHPLALHVVDISENNTVELVRDIRSTLGYIEGDFRTFAIDCGSVEFEALIRAENPYHYVFNLSALKHVRSEKDPYTLMRMIEVNVLNSLKTINETRSQDLQKYFCVSTDKATNPVNMMGASKKIMEMYLMRESESQTISTSRFANVAFSDGSLLHGFNQRFIKKHPITAPNDVKRYFITPKESGELCLMSALLGKNRDIFFPKLNERLNLMKFSDIARFYLDQHGYQTLECETEHEARVRAEELIPKGIWPCFFFESDTTGEKDFEEFYTQDESVDMERFDDVGIVRNDPIYSAIELDSFAVRIESLRARGVWTKSDIVDAFFRILPDFSYEDKGKYLDERM